MRQVVILLVALALLVIPDRVHAFSVLAHQGVVDQAWQSTLLPAVQKRFPNASEQDLEDARAYAHGGSHLPDLGYFPLGSRLFTDLLHYVRTGDFTRHLLADARTPQDYAFALGMLAHYTVDSIGHPQATNMAVPIIYPKLGKEYGRRVTYAESPTAHLETEFRFDVLQVAHRQEIPNLFEHSIDFKVPGDLLDRAFQQTYGLGLKDIFKDYAVALTTYRWGFRTLLNEATGIAWELYREDITTLEPNISKKQFVQKISRADFVKTFGNAFLQPGFLVRFVGFLGNVVPSVGPLKRLPFKPLPARVQELYFRAYHQALDQYVKEVELARIGGLRLPNLTLDTGRPSRPGEYAPADKAYVELLRLHAQDHFARMPGSLARDMSVYFRDPNKALAFEDDKGKRQEDLQVVNEFKAWMRNGGVRRSAAEPGTPQPVHGAVQAVHPPQAKPAQRGRTP